MSYQKIMGKKITWWHASPFDTATEKIIRNNFKFHNLDYEDIKQDFELPKIDEYKYYIMAIFPIPIYDVKKNILNSQNLTLFLENSAVITAVVKPITSVDDLFTQIKNHGSLKRELLSESNGKMAHKILETVFKETGKILDHLIIEARNLEEEVYKESTRQTTKNLGLLRKNILRIHNLIDPQRRAVRQLADTEKTFIKKETKIYFEDIEDLLNSYMLIISNLKATIDSLFEVNEAFLAHRTNDTIRALTVISVVLMVPTLVASFYGMNVANLPFSKETEIVLVIIGLSLIFSLLIIQKIIQKASKNKK